MSAGILGGNVAAFGVSDVTFDPASCGTATVSELTTTLVGAKVGDMVFVNKPTITAGLALGSARISAANTLAVQFVNPTAAAIDPASETYKVLWVRPEGGVGKNIAP